MRDATYEQQILELTGRTIEKREFRCNSCDGLGSSMWEEICTNCAGEGVTLEYAFNDSICSEG